MPDIPARLIAFYLPQFHPIPENDAWWGKGFTEWLNVAKATQLFPGHYQPHIPADLGFYDLRLPETRIAQAEMAREYGIEGFCYYHYWFAGKRLLERPFNEVLRSGKPNFPFCLCWANESWTGVWHGSPDRILIEQTYPGPDDDAAHFHALLQAFCDDRYITVDDKPLFMVYAPHELPHAKRTTDLWRELALKSGLKGLYLVGIQNEPWIPGEHGFDGASVRNLGRVRNSGRGILWQLKKAYRKNRGFPELIYSYKNAIPHLLLPESSKLNVYPAVIPNWDNTPRVGLNGWILHGSTPELFEQHLRSCIQQIHSKPSEHRIIFVKSWNEWAEGNHLEPDLVFGRGYLEVVRKEIFGDDRPT
jgi:lipopolysaccharide biosynthesis protein